MNYNPIELIIEFFRLSLRIVFQGFYILYLKTVILIEKCVFKVTEFIWKTRVKLAEEKLARTKQRNDW